MKSFDYTYRGKDGRVAKGTVQAPDRAAAVREVKTTCGVPLAIAEVRQAAERRHPHPTVVLVAVTLFLVAVSGFLLFAPKDRRVRPDPAVPPTSQGAEDRLPVERGNISALSVPSVPLDHIIEPVETVVPPQGTAAIPTVVSRAERTIVAAPNAPLPIRGAQRRLAEAIRRGERVNPLFGRVSEGVLALYAEPGNSVVNHPLPDNFEKDMRDALAEDIVVTDTDTPEEEREKELVAWLKEDVRRHIARGGTAAGYMEILRERRERDAEMYDQARTILYDFVKDGGTEEALAAHRALNDELEAVGITPLPLPARIRRELKAKGVGQ